MSYLGRVSNKASDIRVFDVTSSTSATHTLTWTAPNEQSLIVTINGIKQHEDAYSVSGTTLTLTDPLVATDKLEVIGINDLGTTLTPAQNSITNDMVSSTAAIDNSKMASDTTDASNISSGTLGTARMGSGTASSSTILYGDGTWKSEYDDSGLQDDIALIGFKVASNGSLAKYNLVDQTVDDFQDASGVDASASTDATRNATGKYYAGSSAASGGTVTTDGSYSIHTFPTGSTNFVTGKTGTIDVLLVAGGGAGGGNHHGAGGGAGGVIYQTGLSLAAGTNSIVVGAGGTGVDAARGGAGSDTTGVGMTAMGGGGGGNNAETGGGGGGSGGGGGASNGTAGSSTQTSNGGGTGYGNAGGAQASSYGAAGGGGAGGAGAANGGQGAGGAGGGVGGVGISNSITGSAVFYGGGGGGASYSGTSYRAPGGDGGGGFGEAYNTANNTAGTDGLGGGGGGIGGYTGGSGNLPGADGGDGTAIIRFLSGSLDSIEDMTLVSNSTTAEATPTKGDLVMTYSNGVGTATLNTDLKAYVSRDNGTTYTQGTLASQGTTGGHTIVTFHDLDISSQPSGTAMRYKIETLNQSATKATRIQAVSLGWS